MVRCVDGRPYGPDKNYDAITEPSIASGRLASWGTHHEESDVRPPATHRLRRKGLRLHVARKQCRHGEWDPPIEPYGPYGPGVSQRAASDFDVITHDQGDTSPAESDTSPVMSDTSPADE